MNARALSISGKIVLWRGVISNICKRDKKMNVRIIRNEQKSEPNESCLFDLISVFFILSIAYAWIHADQM